MYYSYMPQSSTRKFVAVLVISIWVADVWRDAVYDTFCVSGL